VSARLAALLSLVLCAALLAPAGALAQAGPPAGRVTFPTDALTVADASQATGRRMNLPLPDCAVEKSRCAEISLVNELDGFDLDPRITLELESAPPSDPTALAALFDVDALFVQPVAGGDRIGLNRFVVDGNRLFGQPVEQLRESTRYRVVYRGQAVEFTTMTATAGLAQMRRQLDDGSAYRAAGISDADRRISFTQGSGDDEIRTVFAGPNVGMITRYDERVPRGELVSEMVIDTAQVASVPGTYAFGSLTVPSWLDGDQTIPAAPTRGAGPQARGSERIGITLTLPQGPAPEGGWPVAIFGPGITRSKYDLYLVSDFNATPSGELGLPSRRFATISFDPVGHAFGPRSEVGVRTIAPPTETRFSGFGRGRDLNNDGVITNQEGVQAPLPPHPRSAVALRDGLRQTAADVMAIARAISLGVDVDGDGTSDLATDDVSFYALSLGGIYGTMLMGADPVFETAALNVPGGPIAEIARLGFFRFNLTQQLRDRIPALLNGGRSGFTESRPLFLDPPVTSPALGATAIQDLLDRTNWINRPGSPESFAAKLERDPLPDSRPKKVLYQFALGDQTVPNPTSATLARAFGNFDQVAYYRNDRTASASLNPHGILADPTIQGRNQAQLQAIEWLASRGENLIDPDPDPGSPRDTWETPIVDREALERPNFSDDVLGPEADAPRRALTRLAGPGRVATAAAISAATYDEAGTVVLARADDYADALAGGPLAVAEGAPLLLTDRAGLSPEAAAEIERLGADAALLLGGAGALSEQVEADLVAAGVAVTRVSGANRFATAVAIAERLPFSPEVFVTEGENADRDRGWPDALSASSVASALGQPILLVNRDRLPEETAAFLTEAMNATIVGGTAAVSADVAARVDREVLAVTRIAGGDRYATSRAMADEGLRRGLAPTTTYLATGRAFADGLVAGAAAGAVGGSLLLTDGQAFDAAVGPRTWVRDHSRGIDELRLAGGGAAISAASEGAVRGLLR
jgi:hypothetical protein